MCVCVCVCVCVFERERQRVTNAGRRKKEKRKIGRLLGVKGRCAIFTPPRIKSPRLHRELGKEETASVAVCACRSMQANNIRSASGPAVQ